MNDWSNCGVYRILNTLNQKVYIGSSADLSKRCQEHFGELKTNKHYNPKLQNAFNKYGESVFEFDVIIYCPTEQLLEKEQLAIDAFDAVHSGYNIALQAGAPMRGRTSSESTKQKLRVAMTGRFVSEDTREKHRVSSTGRTHSNFTRALFCAQRKGKTPSVNYDLLAVRMESLWRDPDYRENSSSAIRAGVTDETRRKHRESSKGRVVSQEERLKSRLSNLGQKRSSEFCKKMVSAWTPERRAAQAIRIAERNRSKSGLYQGGL
jgi:group I intron endonuclease